MKWIRPSVITRLAIGFGILLAISFIVLATVFYSGTIGVLNQSIDHKIAAISTRLQADAGTGRRDQLANAIRTELSDGIDSDSELYLAIDGAGALVAGNLVAAPAPPPPMGQLVTRTLVRNGRSHRARLLAAPLAGGGLLIVGHDLSEQEAIQALVWTALATGGGTSILLGVIGALLFRRQIVGRLAEIRLTAKGIEAGDLSRRIPTSGDDEFGLLNRDINRMLDRIEQLMDGVRHVSNAIAHDLRTPLCRVRSKLEDVLRPNTSHAALVDAAQGTIADVDALIQLFEKLLYIAEAESGMRDRHFERIDLDTIANDMVELYDATAEQAKSTLLRDPGPPVYCHGDRNLLGSAVASLIDNAIKYAGPGATIRVRAFHEAGSATIEVRDNGPGIPGDELPRVTERFYRVDSSRSMPGNGLGLAIVNAIATFHGGALSLVDDAGLVARISLTQG